MNRRLLAYLLLLVALIAGYFVNDHMRRKAAAPAQSATRGETAQPGGDKTPSVPGLDNGRLLVKLANGFTVLVQEDKRFPLVSERLYVRAGSSYEKPGQEGISHLLEHMVFNSTTKRPKGGVAKDVETVGGDVNAATSFDYTVYLADLPSAHWALGLDIFKDMTFGAKFDPQELANEKKVVISELEKGLDEPGRRLFQMSQGMAWEGTPYSHPVIGYKNTVEAVTSQDLHDYVNTLYQPQSMVLVVVGDVDAAKVVAEAERLYGSLNDNRPIYPPNFQDRSPAQNGPKGQGVGGDWNKCYLHLSFPTAGLHSAKDAPLEVLADLLGGGKTSKLERKLRYELQLADSIDVNSITLERGGMLVVDAVLSPDKLDAFWKALTRELAGLKAADFTDQEIDRSKLNIEDAMFRAKETLKGLATKIGYYQFFGFGQQGETNSIYEVRSVDRNQLSGLLDHYVTPGNANLALLMPGKDQAAAETKANAMLASLKADWPQPKTLGQDQAEAGKTGEAEVVDLGGGRTVVLLPDSTLPYASVSLTFRGGDALLEPSQQGLGDLAAKALTRSTAKRTAHQVEDFLADRASAISAQEGRDTFSLSAKYPARFAPDVLGLLQEIALQPAFAPEEFARARQIQLAQIAQTKDNPTALAFRNLFPFLMPGSHYGYYRQGVPAQVAAFAPDQARAFWDKQRRMPFVLAVCGEFDRQAVIALAKRLAQAGTPLTAPPYEPAPWGKERSKRITAGERNQTHLFWVFPVPGRDSPDSPALELIKTALAGQGGLLFTDLRDRQGLGYVVTAFLWQAPKTGFLALYIGTYPEKAEQARQGFEKVAAELTAKGLPQEEIARAVNVMQGDYYIERQSLSSRSQEASSNLALGSPLDYDRQLLAKAKTLGPKEVADAVAKYLDPNKAYWLTIAP
ncbi:pitrilysin family protein [Fundidesulfovibrio butyratiphilus]